MISAAWAVVSLCVTRELLFPSHLVREAGGVVLRRLEAGKREQRGERGGLSEKGGREWPGEQRRSLDAAVTTQERMPLAPSHQGGQEAEGTALRTGSGGQLRRSAGSVPSAPKPWSTLAGPQVGEQADGDKKFSDILRGWLEGGS